MPVTASSLPSPSPRYKDNRCSWDPGIPPLWLSHAAVKEAALWAHSERAGSRVDGDLSYARDELPGNIRPSVNRVLPIYVFAIRTGNPGRRAIRQQLRA